MTQCNIISFEAHKTSRRLKVLESRPIACGMTAVAGVLCSWMYHIPSGDGVLSLLTRPDQPAPMWLDSFAQWDDPDDESAWAWLDELEEDFDHEQF